MSVATQFIVHKIIIISDFCSANAKTIIHKTLKNGNVIQILSLKLATICTLILILLEKVSINDEDIA